jgi:hypothetical protein
LPEKRLQCLLREALPVDAALIAGWAASLPCGVTGDLSATGLILPQSVQKF